MRLGFIGKSVLQISLILSLFIYLFGASGANAQDGEQLFNAKCAKCHHPVKVVTGPALQNVRTKWEASESDTLIYLWVKNYTDAVKISPYAASVQKSMPTDMELFTDLDNAQIDAILDYVDGYTEDTAGNQAGGGGMTEAGGDEGGISVWWYVIGGVLFIIIFAAASTRRQLAHLQMEKEGEDPNKDETYVDITKSWAKKNQGAVGIIGLVTLFTLLVISYGWMKDIGVPDEYHPSQPIPAFSHNIHADINKIDCQYCHNSASKSKHAGLPTVNVCMNCHRSVDGASTEGKESVTMVRKAAGFDGQTYTGETSPIVWNKVHVLPDHVYFNHSQHVEVGGMDCQNCHGPVEKMTTAHVAKVGDLTPAGGFEDNRLTRPTLTMGWCIECHGKCGCWP